MAVIKAANVEPIPGYRLVEPLGSGGFGEVWKCTAPGGFQKAIKFVAGANDDVPHGHALARQELTALEHVRGIRHPFLLSMERVEVVNGELCIVMELADSSLQDLLATYQQMGQPGIPRDELLGYLCEAAEVLDVMNVEHGLQHLDVKPGNLFLVGDHVKVADFGLVQAHGHEGQTVPPHGLSPLYAAPEVFQNQFSNASDQYSLAIVYYELLTGRLPFLGKNFRQLMMQHATAQPDLSVLPPEDRPIVAKALAKKPSDRFASCQALASALLTGRIALPGQGELARVTKSRAFREARRRALSGGHPAETTPNEPHVLLAAHPCEDSSARPATLAEERETTSEGHGLGGVGTVAEHDLDKTTDAQGTFEFVQALSENPLGSWWQALDEAGQACLVKMLNHQVTMAPQDEARALLTLQQLRHPGVLPVRRIVKEPGRILLVSDLIPTTLWGHFQRQPRETPQDVKREQLLGMLRKAAATLDEIAQTQKLHHWTLNPQNVLLDGERVLLTELGLAQLFWQNASESLGALNPRCGAPELFAANAQVDGRADVFSLGAIYYWLMTGQCPFRATSTVRAPHAAPRRHVDLDALARPDRRPLAKALHADPQVRFATCQEFIAALEKAWGIGKRPGGNSTPNVDLTMEETNSALHALVDGLSRTHASEKFGNGHHVWVEEDSLVHACGVRLVPGMFELRLRDFQQRWHAELVSASEREVRLKFHARAAGLWNLLRPRERGLALDITVEEPAVCGASLASLRARLSTFGCASHEVKDVLLLAGPPILESLRASLVAGPERRQQDRHAFEIPLTIAPAQNHVKILECKGKDISTTGVGLRLPQMPPSRDVVVFVPVAGSDRPLKVPGRVVRMQACLDGGFELGIRFRLPTS